MLPLVKAEHTYGCSAAALATLACVSFKEGERLIREHRCKARNCLRCLSGLPRHDVTSSTAHLVSILRSQGYTAKPTQSFYGQKEYPVLIKIKWARIYSGAHMVIWDAADRVFLDPSHGPRGIDAETARECFALADEPAYIIRHPKLLAYKGKPQPVVAPSPRPASNANWTVTASSALQSYQATASAWWSY